jgi:hypothetical protein
VKEGRGFTLLSCNGILEQKSRILSAIGPKKVNELLQNQKVESLVKFSDIVLFRRKFN